MKKRTVTIWLAIVLFIPFVSQKAYAGDLLSSKAVYYTEESDYAEGDCILTATRMMIRRAAIMHGRSGWKSITNESLRPEATMDGMLLYSFCYDAEGLSYSIDCGSFEGESSYERVREFEHLLKDHPEGIVVWGMEAASTGTHGVLVVKAENGEVYAMDSSFNMGPMKEGIQKWTDTTMLDPLLVTDYWYISGISETGPYTGTDAMKASALKALHFKLLRQHITTV